jgi:hypothetical protein
MKYIKLTSYRGNYGFDQSMCQIDFTSPQGNSEVLNLKDAHNQLHDRSDHHSPLKDKSHDRSIQDMKDFLIEGSHVIDQRNFNV